MSSNYSNDSNNVITPGGGLSRLISGTSPYIIVNHSILCCVSRSVSSSSLWLRLDQTLLRLHYQGFRRYHGDREGRDRR